MVFVDSDGRVLERKPWMVAAVELIHGIGNAIAQFFSTLLSPFSQPRSEQSNNTRHGWLSGSGGSGSGSNGGGGGNGGGPNRRIGRIVNSMDCNPPGGGCPGGGCGR